jgi:fumarate reductase flavoprotein subunit
MWDDVGILREGRRLRQAIGRLAELDSELDRTGVDGTHRDYNMSWHDWLNLKSLIAVSRVIATAALSRENSRGAHFREDFPDAGDLATSSFTVARQHGDKIEIAHERVQFTRVKPGHSLVGPEAEAIAARP